MKNKLKFLYNPFEKIAGWQAFAVGIVIVIISVLIACDSNQYFEGVFNIRLIQDANLQMAFIYQSVSLILMVLLFYCSGLIFSKGVRFQDVLGTVTLSRTPYIIPAFFGYIFNYDEMQQFTSSLFSNLLSNDFQNIMGNLSLLMLIALVLILVLIWYVILLWNAFRVSTDIKGGKGVLIFIAVIILSEILFNLFKYLIN